MFINPIFFCENMSISLKFFDLGWCNGWKDDEACFGKDFKDKEHCKHICLQFQRKIPGWWIQVEVLLPLPGQRCSAGTFQAVVPMPPQRHLPCQGSSACLKSRQIRQNGAQRPTLNCQLRSRPTTVCKCSSISPSRAHRCKVMRQKNLPLGVAYLQPWRHQYPASLQTDSKQCFKKTQHRVKRLNLECKSSHWPASYRIFQIRTISLHLGNLRTQIFWCKNSTRLPEKIFTKLPQHLFLNISSGPVWPWTNLDQHQDQSLPPGLPPSLQLFWHFLDLQPPWVSEFYSSSWQMIQENMYVTQLVHIAICIYIMDKQIIWIG